jgi:hypothetical protein
MLNQRSGVTGQGMQRLQRVFSAATNMSARLASRNPIASFKFNRLSYANEGIYLQRHTARVNCNSAMGESDHSKS